MKYKGIIFDCDGVLVDSEVLSNKILVNMANALGANINLAFALKYFAGRSLRSCMDYIEHQSGLTLPNNFTAKYRQRSYQIFQKQLKPISGVHALLDQLKMPYCVASSGPIEKIRLNLTITNLIDKFEDRLFSSYEIDSWKPEPDIFLHAAQKMGFEPSKCAVIEDSLVGAQAGLAGGFDVYAYLPDKTDNIFSGVDVNVFSHMDELSGLL